MALAAHNLARVTLQCLFMLGFTILGRPSLADGDGNVIRAVPDRSIGSPTFRIGPIDGLTTEWHPAPAETSVPTGTILLLHQSARPNQTVTWRGAYEIARDDTGSTAICLLFAEGRTRVGVEIAPTGSRAQRPFSSNCTLDVVNVRVGDISVSPVLVQAGPPEEPSDPSFDAVNQEEVEADELSDNQAGSDGLAEESVQMVVEVDPPGFASLMEWRLADQPAILGPSITVGSRDLEFFEVEVGPVLAPSTLEYPIEIATESKPDPAAARSSKSFASAPSRENDDSRSRGDADPESAGFVPTEIGAAALWALNGADIYNTNPGNVGIGTMTPASEVKLHVSGGGIGLENNESIWARSSTGTMSNLIFLDGSDTLRARGLLGGFQINDSGGAATLVSVLNDGSVGIGTAEPQGLLHLKGSGGISQLLVEGDTAEIVIGRTFPGNDSVGNLVFANGSPRDPANYHWSIGERPGGSNLHFFNENIDEEVMVLDFNFGSVGIGTSNPSALVKLHMGGGLGFENGEGMWWRETAGSMTRLVHLDADDTLNARGAGGGVTINDSRENSLVSVLDDGTVGIGTTSPANLLHLKGDQIKLLVESTNGADIVMARESLTNDNQLAFTQLLPNEPTFYQWTIGQHAGEINLSVRNESQDETTMFFNSVSNFVGIGTDAPASELDVDGTTTTDVLIITGGSDLAEPFDMTDRDVDPGMVVCIDPQEPGKLCVSSKPYDHTVAGVISGAGGINPGICLSQEGVTEGETLVAMTGRLYVKCSTENGPIQPGDLLTTASLPGYAMKATDAGRSFGAVIGKAMSPLEEGAGLVLVLVNLQ